MGGVRIGGEVFLDGGDRRVSQPLPCIARLEKFHNELIL